MSRPTSQTPTDWELFLLQILWDKGASSVDDVREILRSKGLKRSDSAVRKMLQIMVDKKLVKSANKGRTAYYRPAVKRKSMEKSMFQHLIHTLFGGDEEVFLLRALDESSVTQDVVEKMKAKLRDYENHDEST